MAYKSKYLDKITRRDLLKGAAAAATIPVAGKVALEDLPEAKHDEPAVRYEPKHQFISSAFAFTGMAADDISWGAQFDLARKHRNR